jgi:N-acetyl-gamma-glutamyl-phosphate reductase
VTTVHVWGASGYAAAEAIRLLSAHPLLEIGVLESRSHAGSRVADHFPDVRTLPHAFAPVGSMETALQPGDVVIAAGSHGEALTHVPSFVGRGARVVDLSADHRFNDDAAYGLTEWNREAISRADLVANPGCYPTATLLGLLPLVRAMRPRQLIVDAKSGITGAGRNPAVASLYAEVTRDIRPYGLDGHRHQGEIEHILAQYGATMPFVFTPHVVPLARGMLVDAYALFDAPVDAAVVRSLYRSAYAASAFVRVLDQDQTPSVAAVVGTNDTEIRIDVHGSVVRVICAIDNLGKGAAGQAVANINVMLGMPEETGFGTRAIVA